MRTISRCARFLAACLLGVFALSASAAVLLTGYGSADSEDAARAAAREDLAHRLQRAVVLRLKTESARRAFVEGREFPLIGIEMTSAGARGSRLRYEARLTDASLATYEREAGWLAERLRKLDPARISAEQETPARLAEWFAWLDQHRRIAAVLRAFSSKRIPEVALDEAALGRLAVKNLSAPSDPKELARAVKTALDRSNISGARVVAPVRAENSEVTGLSGQIADDLRRELGPPAADRAARHTLDGTYETIEGRILLRLFLLDASFNTERGFVFVLQNTADRGFRALPSANGLAEALSRGLVRVDLPDGGAVPESGTDGVMGVDVRTERGRRGLYYHPGDRDQLLVKLDRPGYYYIVGHVEKANTRISYLMEIGEPAGGSRFVRRVSAEGTNQWQAVGQFTVEPPFGLEAVQVFATSESPERALPPARFDPSRNLYLIGTDPSEAVKRARGLVLVNMTDPGNKAPSAPRPVVGEAVLQFMTLQ
jgi:hypothetical protein